MPQSRRLAPALALVAVAMVGGFVAFGTHSWQATYADPTASAVEHLKSSATWIGAWVAVFALVAAVAVFAAKGSLRRAVASTAAALVVLTAIGMVAGNHYGLRAKQREASSVPRCAVGDDALNRHWRALKHPVYFGGGEQSRSHCAYDALAPDLSAALTEYQRQLEDHGWRITESSPTQVAASLDRYRFDASVRRESGGSDRALSVTMRAGP